MSTSIGCHVLIIGGMGKRLERYRTSLRAGGFGVIVTDQIHEGPRLLAAVHPAVCVIDVRSLREKGWAICEAIRAIPSLRQTTIVLLAETTGHPRGVLKARARRLNCTLLGMPVASSDLVDCVATLIGLRPTRPR